ncbi:MAG: hypothetical protein WD055_05690 [Candidatus Dependentiae bacterium]
MQTSFCKSLTLTVLALVSVQQVSAFAPLDTFKDVGEKEYTIHGVFRDLVVKTALHDLVKKHLPNKHFVSLGSSTLDAHDLFNALADAIAVVVDEYVFSDKFECVDTVTDAVKVSCAGTLAHKAFVELLTLFGVVDQVSDEVKDNYDRFGKAWFSNALGKSLNNAVSQLVNRASGN